jgi:hypothetical protein
MAISKAPPPLPLDRRSGSGDHFAGGAHLAHPNFQFANYGHAGDVQLERNRDAAWYALRMRQKAYSTGRPWSPRSGQW